MGEAPRKFYEIPIYYIDKPKARIIARWGWGRAHCNPPIPTSPRRVGISQICHWHVRCFPVLQNPPGIPKFQNSGMSEIPGCALIWRSSRSVPILPNLATSRQMSPGRAESPGNSEIPKFQNPNISARMETGDSPFAAKMASWGSPRCHHLREGWRYPESRHVLSEVGLPFRISRKLRNLTFWGFWIFRSSVLERSRCIFPISPNLSASCQRLPGFSEPLVIPGLWDFGMSEFPAMLDLCKCWCISPAPRILPWLAGWSPDFRILCPRDIRKSENLEFRICGIFRKSGHRRSLSYISDRVASWYFLSGVSRSSRTPGEFRNYEVLGFRSSVISGFPPKKVTELRRKILRRPVGSGHILPKIARTRRALPNLAISCQYLASIIKYCRILSNSVRSP